MVGDDEGPSFGLGYDFRRRLPLGDHTAFYAECLEEIEEGERLGFAGAWLSEHHFVDDGYLPSPLVVAAAVAAWGRLPGVTHEQALENLRLFATGVAPRVREAVGREPA